MQFRERSRVIQVIRTVYDPAISGEVRRPLSRWRNIAARIAHASRFPLANDAGPQLAARLAKDAPFARLIGRGGRRRGPRQSGSRPTGGRPPKHALSRAAGR